MTTIYTKGKGRTARTAIIVITTFLILLVLGVGIGFLVWQFFKLCPDDLPQGAFLIVILAILVIFATMAKVAIGLFVAGNTIFPGSGCPKEMATMLYQSFFLMSQTFLAVLIITSILVMLLMDKLTTAEGLPIITAAGGFALGRQFVETQRGQSDKANNEES